MNKKVPIMPEEYVGKNNRNGGYTETAPRQWTKEEIDWVKKLMKEGFTKKEIADSIGRSLISVQIKIKRLGKTENKYNLNHVKEKYEINKLFLNQIKPKTILDLYCGQNPFYGNCENITTNDIDKSIKADYNEDALKLLCKLITKIKNMTL